MRSSSASARAIFSAEEGWGRLPPKRKDIVGADTGLSGEFDVIAVMAHELGCFWR